MKLLVLSLNHKTASVALREKANFAVDALQPALRDLTISEGVGEATILSTCNRTEIYCRQHNDCEQWIHSWFTQHIGCTSSELQGHVDYFLNKRAVEHVFRVASGLDSMVLGEPQILGQMKAAFHTAASVGATGKVLNRLFQHAFRVAKQVRTDTSIGANSVSVAYAGVSLAKHVFTHLNERTALLIGAGETIELVARHLKESAVKRIIIANRSLNKAKNLARIVGCDAIEMKQLPERLSHADIVISSTASALPILDKGAVEHALEQRKYKPMFILDLAVPRDVATEVSGLRGVHLYNIDDIKSRVEHNRELRTHAAEEAKHIIHGQTDHFMRWMRSLDSLPDICALRQVLDGLQQEEADKAVRRICNGEDPRAVVQQLARNLANKFAHCPSQALKQANIEGNHDLNAAARKLFGI